MIGNSANHSLCVAQMFVLGLVGMEMERIIATVETASILFLY